MCHPFYLALGGQFNRADSNSPRCRRHGSTDWNEIGIRVALAGGIYPLILTSAVLLALVGYLLCFDYPIYPTAGGLLLPLLAMLVAGFPFVFFGCFLCSTLIAVPLLSVFAWLVKRTKLQISPSWITTVSIGFVAVVWTSLLYCTACWWTAFI